MLNDLRHQLLVFFFRVLLVEDAVLRALHAAAPETVLHIREATLTVEEFTDRVPAVITEEYVVHTVASAVAFVAEFAVEPEHAEILAILSIACYFVAVTAVFELVTVEACATPPAFEQIVAC